MHISLATPTGCLYKQYPNYHLSNQWKQGGQPLEWAGALVDPTGGLTYYRT